MGDAVLEIVSSEFLFINYPQKPEGELTKLRASIVCEPTLALCTKPLDLGKYLRLGRARIIQVAERENRFFLMHLRQ